MVFNTIYVLSSHEDTLSWTKIHTWQKGLMESPLRWKLIIFRVSFVIELCFRILLADAAHQITNAGKEVFGDTLIRIMCWSHCHAAYDKKLKALVKKSDLRDEIDQDLKNAQWMISSHQELGIVLDFIAAKYVNVVYESAAVSEGVRAFFSYFLTQWGPESHVSRYFFYSLGL